MATGHAAYPRVVEIVVILPTTVMAALHLLKEIGIRDDMEDKEMIAAIKICEHLKYH